MPTRPMFKELKLTAVLLATFILAAVGASCVSDAAASRQWNRPVPVSVTPLPPGHLAPLVDGSIARVWANSGEDKISRGETRASSNAGAVRNTVWDGNRITLFGAQNEVVSFALILEAPRRPATEVSVSFDTLTGSSGAAITAAPDDAQLFDFRGRNIELFFVRYLQIRGISTDLFFHGYGYDERHLPERCRRPYDPETGEAWGTWEDRPCAGAFYPDIAVPLELHPRFSVDAGTSQTIWCDVTIPRTAHPGRYEGMLTVSEAGVPVWRIPVSLDVVDFVLPDLPTARTMLFVSAPNVADRYLGEAYPAHGSPRGRLAADLVDRHFQLAHRHRISLIDDTVERVEQMEEGWKDRLSGDLFTYGRGYEGPGEGVGNNVYSIGTYGSWAWQDEGRAAMWSHTDEWVRWFDAHDFETPTDSFLYLIDETDDYELVERWSRWMDENPDLGSTLPSMATIDLPAARENTPSLDIPASWLGVGQSRLWEQSAAWYRNAEERSFMLYNGTRPATGSFAIEDDGVALRALAWAQYKMSVPRWFYWESTYYENYQGSTGHTNVFRTAQTYGDDDGFDREFGETGWNYLNGDGVLFYPGTDTRFPEESYGVMMPFASLRLKLWRRGIQDVEYLTQAAEVDPERTRRIIRRLVPTVLWEYGVTDPSDPTWVLTDVSWPSDPDIWEKARLELAQIIAGSRG